MKKNRLGTILCIGMTFLFIMSGCGIGASKEQPADKKKPVYDYRPQISDEMPVININTADGSSDFVTQYVLDHKLQGLIDYVDATITVNHCDEQYVIEDAEAKVKVRGNYTLNCVKKPIRIKFSEKRNLLGLHDEEEYKSWVLLADWVDISMLRNYTAFYLGKTILGSDGYYCTDFRNVEVYVNNQYWGVYLLAEQQEVKDGRTSVPEVEDGYTGTDIGYFFEYDGYYKNEHIIPNGEGDPTFEVSYIDSPGAMPGYTVKSDINDDAQLAFIQSYVEKAYEIAYYAIKENTFYEFNKDYSDIEKSSDSKSVKDTVASVIDLQSLVDTYILNEICCNIDLSWSSFYLSLNMTDQGNKKLTFEAPWDFDIAFGIRSDAPDVNGLFIETRSNPWLTLIAKEPWFIDMVKEKWLELKKAGVFDTALFLIEEQTTTYEACYAREYSRWNRPGFYIEELSEEQNAMTSQGQAAEWLYQWLSERIAYLNSQWS